MACLLPSDPISFTVSDGNYNNGLQILDRTTYHPNGPYGYLIEGESSGWNSGYGEPLIQTDNVMKISGDTSWPCVFEMTVQVEYLIGEVSYAMINGNMVTAQYGRPFRPHNDL